MNLKKLFSIRYYYLHINEYKEYLKDDEYALSTFRGGDGKLSADEKKLIEYKAVKQYRLYQCHIGTVWGHLFGWIFRRITNKYGMDLACNPKIGRGLVIGHWGRIVLSGNAVIGEQVMLTHGVTIGRDIRGDRKGDPIIGNRVCIRANSTVVGNITIGDDVVIAPNTFVNFDVPSHSIVIGNPATIHRKENASEGHVGRLPNE